MYLDTLIRTKLSLTTMLIAAPITTFIVNNMDTLLSITVETDRRFDYWTQFAQNQQKHFHYIIVGGGSSGSILASRLSEDPSITVLLLEAGGTPSPFLSLPTVAYLVNSEEAYSYKHQTIPQYNAGLGLNDQRVNWPTGKGLGGSSLTNGMIYVRGNVQGYDLMAQRLNEPIWKMDNILQHFKRIENYGGVFDSRAHGNEGDMYIGKPTLVPATHHFLRAAREMGYKIRDPNNYGVNTEGFARIESSLHHGRRADAYRCTIRKIQQRPNLTIRKYSYVTNLIFRPGSISEVIGVEYERHGTRQSAYSSRETILATGALTTPKILMLSGIGPKEHLQELGIPVRIDLPVGQRLQDKYGGLIGPFIVPKGYSFDQYRDANISSYLYWLTTGKGLLSCGRTEATFAVLSPSAKRRGDVYAPDIHSYLLSQTPNDPEKIFRNSFNLNPASIKYLKDSSKYGDAMFQLVTLNRGIGKGTIKLKDTNPHSLMVIDPKYLQNPQDVQTVVEGIKFAVDLFEKTSAMAEIGAHLYPVPIPGCEGYIFKSDEYYECVARHWTLSAYKFCGTVPMGAYSDPEAVVDSKFRVFGTKGLRVIDSSLFRVNEVNTNDVTMRMVGDLGANMLKTEQNNLHFYNNFVK